jgi:carbonic anhydrase
MEFFSNDVMRELPASSLETAELSPKGFRDVGSGRVPERGIHRVADHPRSGQAVIDDVERIRNHPWVPRSIPMYGLLYDVASGN